MVAHFYGCDEHRKTQESKRHPAIKRLRITKRLSTYILRRTFGYFFPFWFIAFYKPWKNFLACLRLCLWLFTTPLLAIGENTAVESVPSSFFRCSIAFYSVTTCVYNAAIRLCLFLNAFLFSIFYSHFESNLNTTCLVDSWFDAKWENPHIRSWFRFIFFPFFLCSYIPSNNSNNLNVGSDTGNDWRRKKTFEMRKFSGAAFATC